MNGAKPMNLAHAFGAHYDLPIPLRLFVFDGGLVVVLSFLVAERPCPEAIRRRLLRSALVGAWCAWLG